tara:strand:- start:9142 stop:9306 length:165 start_codon:yes stop_codon:yes gene_type:complete
MKTPNFIHENPIEFTPLASLLNTTIILSTYIRASHLEEIATAKQISFLKLISIT